MKRVRGRVKWLAFIDLGHIQCTHDVSYWIAYVGWCLWWDIYDRGYNILAGVLGLVIMCARTYWILKTKIYFFVPAVLTSMAMAYSAFLNLLK